MRSAYGYGKGIEFGTPLILPPSDGDLDAVLSGSIGAVTGTFNAIWTPNRSATVAGTIGATTGSFSVTVVDPTTPATIHGGNLIAWWRPGVGVTLNGSKVATWADQSGNGHDLSNGTDAARPTYNATGGPNSKPSMLFDGSDDRLNNTTIDRPAPGTTATYFVLICRQITWTGNRALWGGNTAFGLACRQGGAEPEIQQYDGNGNANEGTGLTLNTWGRVAAGYTGSVASFMKIIGTEASGENPGNSNSNGFSIGAANAFGVSNIEVCEAWMVSGIPNTTQRDDEDDYITTNYGSGLV